MQIVEIEAIPRDRTALQGLIDQSRRGAARSRTILIVAGLMCMLAVCILMYGCTRSQPHSAITTLYIPLLQK